MLVLPLALLTVVAQPPVPSFEVHSTNPAPVVGKVTALAADGSLTLADPGATVAAGNLVGLRRGDRPLPPWPRGPQVLLSNGDRIEAAAVGGSNDDLDVSPSGVTGDRRTLWAVPITSLAAVWVTAPPSGTPTDPAAYPWFDPAARRDAVLLRNGDVVRGVVEGFTDGPAVRIKAGADAAVQLFELTRVAAIVFDPSLARPRKPKGPHYRLVTAGGSRVHLKAATIAEGVLKGETLFGAKFDVPLASVAALDVLLGKATYLSDLKPKRAVTEGFNGVQWPWTADRTVRGEPLRLRGPDGERTYDKGLGTHSRTTLVFAPTAKHQRFETTVGLDAVSGRKGAAEVRVLLDGKPALTIDRLTAADAPQWIALDLNGAKELTLVVDYGTGVPKTRIWFAWVRGFTGAVLRTARSRPAPDATAPMAPEFRRSTRASAGSTQTTASPN